MIKKKKSRVGPGQECKQVDCIQCISAYYSHGSWLWTRASYATAVQVLRLAGPERGIDAQWPQSNATP